MAQKVGVLLTFLVLFFPFSPVSAQYDISTLDLDGDITRWFDGEAGLDHTQLLSGSYQRIQRNTRNTHQFFLNDSWGPAKINYYGQDYQGVHLLYDLEFDLVLLRHPIKVGFYSQPIKLQQDKISSFTLFNHSFKFYTREVDPPMSAGFYDELFMGEQVQLIVKRAKEKKVHYSELVPVYEDFDKYFMKFEGTYHHIYKKRSILKVLANSKRELRRYIRRNNLDVRAGNDIDLIQLLSYYDHLKQGL